MAEDGSKFPPVRACLFDMDGLLLNTEDLYTIVTNKLLHKYGKPTIPWSIKAQLQGRPRAEANHIFQTWAQLPITMEEYYEQQSVLQAELFPSSKPLPGAEALLKGLRARKVEVALATSSHEGNFYIKTDHLKDFMSAFVQERRVLGDDPRIPNGKGKPAPDIYLVALQTINKDLERDGQPKISPKECLVFEDSVPGAEAGRRAGMRVVWCPHLELLAEFKGREAEVLAGQIGTGEQVSGLEEGNAVMPEKAEAGWPGRKDDGWGELLLSLEDFDYSKYGMGTQ